MRGMASISARFAKSFMANGIERSRNRLSSRAALSAKALGMTRAPVADALRCIHLYRVMRQGRQSGCAKRRRARAYASPRPRVIRRGRSPARQKGGGQAYSVEALRGLLGRIGRRGFSGGKSSSPNRLKNPPLEDELVLAALL